MSEIDYIQLSGIQHFSLCKRQWALIHIENKWTDNWRTIDGTIMHERVHDSSLNEKRGDVITMRALRVVSHTLKVAGECDAVEFIRNGSGIELFGYADKYIPFPVEYKRGKAKSIDADKMQLCAQAICLEEMLACSIKNGALFYGEPHRRVEVEFTQDLRNKVADATKEMHEFIKRGYTPRATKCEYCNQCSLKDDCIPAIGKKQSINNYIKKYLAEG
ncbi:MAG: CRISPR-associated protein Cas4 [Clostridia bacterium]|jgi:CRISPR-associated exonuclease Cas4|nr:CRISPR-associated protein Cas4 [Clostridia bacterium]MDD3232419.1 CRISPR-associated protein Cas4 [Clostridia bacterium]MDD3862728.1 CRISPR-associated protein Cas4 [Clostridia bacterium]MDD4408939.1 CRISPR-associated protein Cas4 [Clostridia bacterium]